MEVAHTYTKKRSEFGHYVTFEDVPASILESIAPSSEYDGDYIPRNPCVTTLDTTPLTEEHEVSTDRVLHRNQGMRHYEGGWPENVDGGEADQVDRYLKKANKDNKYKATVAALGGTVESAVKQNNTIDIYEEYFTSYDLDLSSEPPSAKGLAVFRDPAHSLSSTHNRTVTCINWHPEGNKIAVAYSVLKFQDERVMSGRMHTSSYIWDIEFPNTPVLELLTPSPLVSLRYNVKTPDVVVGGCYNGLVAVYDLKKPRGNAAMTSSIERSHHDPVYDVYWIQSKTNNQFVSVSTDGQMLWWDTRRLVEPTDSLTLTHTLADGSSRVLGGCSLEYNIEAGPAKYLVGTEQGIVLSLNMRKRGAKGGSDAGVITAQDSAAGSGKHHTHIHTITRNPMHPTAYLTIGDWSARIWSEKNKTPIMMTPYCKAYLTAGSWSPTRAGVFYTCRNDGVMDVWDIFYRQNAVAYSHKVADYALSSMSVQNGGRLLAVGDVNGTVSLLEVSENLAVAQAAEKNAIGYMFERESKREENLEKRAQALARMARAASVREDDGSGPASAAGTAAGGDKDDGMEEVLRKVDTEFMNLIKAAEEDENKEDGAAASAAASASS